jgi:hypothetical protein
MGLTRRRVTLEDAFLQLLGQQESVSRSQAPPGNAEARGSAAEVS